MELEGQNDGLVPGEDEVVRAWLQKKGFGEEGLQKIKEVGSGAVGSYSYGTLRSIVHHSRH